MDTGTTSGADPYAAQDAAGSGLPGGGSRPRASLAFPDGPGASAPTTRIVLDLRSVWWTGWVVVGVITLVSIGQFFLADAGSFVFLVVMALFLAMALEPLVARLSTRMPRPAATGIVLIVFLGAVVGFFWLFGSMLTDQVVSLIKALPEVATSLLDWVNTRFGTSFATDTILTDLGLTQEKITAYATSVAGDLLTIVGGVASSALNVFSFLFFAFYVSAGMPRLRTWTAGLLRPDLQVVFLTVWQTMLIKVGGYVGARLLLAFICGTATGICMLVIGMPYWLPLALWTGLVAQFIPNIGTYIAIALPVIVGLTSAEPMDGVLVLVFALAYQQIENIFIEPRISSRAVDVHPAMSFASALVGAQLFGLAGATLGVPVAATIMAIFDIYKQRWEVTTDTEETVAALVRSRERTDEEDRDGGGQGAAGGGAGGAAPGGSTPPTQQPGGTDAITATATGHPPDPAS